jgi:hypothetical protein
LKASARALKKKNRQNAEQAHGVGRHRLRKHPVLRGNRRMQSTSKPRTRQQRVAARIGLIGLIGVSLLALAPVGRAETRTDAFPRLELEVLPTLLSRSPALRQELVVELPLPEPLKPLVHGPFICGCRGFSGFRWAPRPPRLPDPVAALGESFRNSRAIKAVVLDQRVLAADYPDGYFGDWTQDGMLVTARIDIAGETSMQLLFRLLTEAIGEADSLSEEEWAEPGEPDPSVNEYRRTSGFSPGLSLEFPGEPCARVDIALTQQRLLLQVGDRWESYALDRWSAEAIEAFLSAQDRGRESL